MGLHLHGVGHFHPGIEITNRFLEELDIGTDDAWIQSRVGIRSRRTVLPLDYIRTTRNREPRAALEAAVYGNAQLARRAAEMALARAGIDSDAIGMVISGTSAADTAAPAEATDLVAVARGAGIVQSAWAKDEADFERLVGEALAGRGPRFIGARVNQEPGAGRPERDPVLVKDRFMRGIGAKPAGTA